MKEIIVQILIFVLCVTIPISAAIAYAQGYQQGYKWRTVDVTRGELWRSEYAEHKQEVDRYIKECEGADACSVIANLLYIDRLLPDL